jgi:hypothetical protein
VTAVPTPRCSRCRCRYWVHVQDGNRFPCVACSSCPDYRPPVQLVRSPPAVPARRRRFWWPLNWYQAGLALRGLAAIIAIAAMIAYATGTRPDRWQAVLYTFGVAVWALNPWPSRPRG